jgi:hypothetical protein
MLDIQLGDELVVGTRLVVRRRGYAHQGIYSGHDRVIHYAGRIRYPHGRIEEIGLEEFAAVPPSKRSRAAGFEMSCPAGRWKRLLACIAKGDCMLSLAASTALLAKRWSSMRSVA